MEITAEVIANFRAQVQQRLGGAELAVYAAFANLGKLQGAAGALDDLAAYAAAQPAEPKLVKPNGADD